MLEKTAKRRIVAAKSKRRPTIVGISQRTKETKLKGHSKTNDKIKRNMYTWITRHTQVVQ